MKPDRLRNLLKEMETRLVRAEKTYRRSSDVGQIHDDIKADVRRYLSKVDSLGHSDINALETKVNQLTGTGHDLGLLNQIAGLKIGLNQLGPDEILDALPGQKTAAFQFIIDDDIIRVVDQPLRPSSREKDMAMAALEGAIEHGAYVASELAATNLSPRVKEAFQQLQTTMGGYKNIVQVGSRAQICNRLVHGNTEELSSTVFSLLIGHIENVFSALAQFEDWRIYSENAAAMNIDAGSVEKLTQATAELISRLRQEPAVDLSVVEALDMASRWVQDGDQLDNRDVLALTRSWENMWSAVSRIVLGLGRDLISDGRKRVATIILTSLLAMSGIVPVIAKIPGGSWIETVSSYFKSVRQ